MTAIGYTALGAAKASGKSTPAALAKEPALAYTDEARARAAAVAFLDGLVGTPYIWAGKDPKKGLDCSGAVLSAYEHAGFARPGARFRYGSADLKKKLEPTSAPERGDVAFYGPSGKVNHVMLVVGDGRVIGSTGGGRNTKTPDDAMKVGAYVKYKPVNYRKDLIGFGKAPAAYAALDGSSITVLTTSDAKEDYLSFAGKTSAAGLTGWLAWHLFRRFSR